MKVLVLTNMYPTPENPVLGSFVQFQVESLRAKGVICDVLLVNGPKSRVNYLLGPLSLARQMRRQRYDLIHAHYHFSAYIARTQFQYPIVLTHHGPEVIQGWEKPFSHAITPFVDAVIAVSPEVKTILGDPRIRVIPCGIDLERFAPGDQAGARRELGLAPGGKLVLWAASMTPRKRLDRAQAAVALLKGRLPDVELVVASGLRPELIPLYMKACDVLALTSESEGSPQVVKEAMACNLPVVSMNVGDVADVIGGTDGCYVAETNPVDIADKLELVLRRGRRTEGRSAVMKYGLPAIADRVIEVYEETLKRRTFGRVSRRTTEPMAG